MSRKRQSILLSGAILAAGVWLFALAMLFSQPGASVDTSTVPTLASLPDVASETEQANSETAGQIAVEKAASEGTALPIVVLNPPNQTNVNPAPVSGGDTGLPAVNVPAEPIPNSVIIRFEAGSSEEERAAYIQAIGGQVTQTIDALNTVVVTVPEGVTLDSLPPAAIVSQNEPDFYISAQASPPNDPMYSGQWGLDIVRAPEAWALISSSTPRITVAVVDSGICANHPDLSGRIGSGWDFVQSDETPQDEYGHGCAVAGVIAANGNNNLGIAGVAPNVDIMPLRVLDGQGVGTYSRVAAAIVYATDNGAQIINLSLGGSNPSGVLQDAVNYAATHNVMVIAAAGNSGSPTAMYPAAYENAIAVGSIDTNLQRSGFSNYGPQVDLYAPGSNIASTGLNGYVTMSGTSLATPYVSGVAALEMALGGSLTVDGGIVAFRQTMQVEPTPGSGDVLTCNHQQSYQAYLAFEDLVRQQVENPAAVTDDQIKAARRTYLDTNNDCFVLAYNNGALTIDNEGQWIDGQDASAQFRPFGTKWGANSPFPMLQPPAITGGTVTFSFMPSGVSLALKEGIPSSTVLIAINQLEPEVTDNFPQGTCNLQQEVRSAITVWSDVADINFQEVIDGGQPFNHANGVVGDIRIGSHFIDGEGNELGHAFFPGPVPDEPNATGVGDLFFDAADNWGCETVRDVAGNVIVLDIGVVTTHEIGHAIGLRHQNAPPGAVMNPTYNDAISNLAPDDIDGVRAIYGVDTLEAPPLLPVTLSGNIATFNWTEVANGNAAQYQIEVALVTDPTFSAPVISTTVPAPPLTATAPLDNNTYIWRVRGYLDGYGPYSNMTSPNATFTVAFGVPNLVAPLNGEIVSNGSVTFQWGSAGASTDTFVLQVATGTQFDSTDLLQNIPNISGLNRAVSGFADGVYYWRVAKTGGDFSLPFQFSIDSNVPGLTFPPNDALLSDGDVDFTWLPVPGATEYQIQIDTSPNFAGLLFLDKLFLDKLFLDKLFLDKLFLDKLFSDKLFLDKLFLDKLFLDKLFLDKLFLDKLFLDKLFLDKLFLDKLFLDKLFLDKLTAPEASFDKPLSEGLHYWRVRARRADGEWGGWSQTFNFRIETRPNIVVNEIKVTDPSFIEIYNAGTGAENLTGWTLHVYQPDSLTPSFSFTFASNCMGGESGCTLGAGDYLVLHEANGVNDTQNIYLGAETINWPLPGEGESASLSTNSVTATSLPIVGAPVVSASAIEAQEAAGVSGRVYLDTVTAQSIITVNTADMVVEDDGQCSLIEAIITANTDTASGGQDFECETSGGADMIVLEADGPYILSGPDNFFDDSPNGTPAVESDITIEGNGQTVVRESEVSFRIFYVTSDGTLTVDNLTVSNGFAGNFNSGGAFRNVGGTLVLNNVTVTENFAGTGGGISSSSGSLTSINDSLIESNGAVSAVGGGGIYNEGIMTITDTTIRDNETDEGAGGGAFNDGLFAIMTLNRSTVSGNHAGSAGGGLRNESGLLVLLNSTVSGNTVSLTGGAIYNSGGSINISFSTINQNEASEGVGGIVTDLGNSAQLRHSIISNNSALNCFSENGEIFAISGTVLDTDASCVDSSVSSEELNLGPLQNNGGPTETHALLDGSVAIDMTDDCTDVESNEVTLDQRSVERPQSSLCDIGAFEFDGEGGDTAQSNPYFVNTTAIVDDGMCSVAHCTIIEAVNAANADGIDSTINLGIGQTYLLTAVNNTTDGANGLPSVTSPITINGNNSNINRDGDAPQFRILHMASGANLTLNELTLSNGNLGLEMTFTIGDLGAGIYKSAAGTLTLDNSTIADNVALGGGGIYSAGGTVNIIDSTIIDNQAVYGGGVSNNGGGTLNIDNSFVSGNGVGDVNGEGGAVFTNSGLVTITNSTFESNVSDLGGGLFIHIGGSANISNSAFTGNDSLTHGGGMAVRGSATVNSSTFSQNVAAFNGGAIDVMDGTAVMTITNSLIENNASNSTGGGTGGGGIANFGTLNLIQSSIVDNESDTDGGGLFNSGTAIINRSTISGNDSVFGAGLYNNATMNVVNSTISGNNASQFGAGVQNWGDFFAVNVTVADNTAVLRGSGIHYSGGSIDFKNSIMANNGDNCAVFEFFSGTITFGESGSNLATDENCGFGFGFAPPSSLALGPLSNNGGPTQTHALLEGSVAIDGVANCTTDGETFLSVDQRGAQRPQGEACDIGAFEFGGEAPVFGTIGGAVALVPPPSEGDFDLLALGDAVPDFVRFGDTNIPAPAGTSFTGGTVDLPPDNLNIGRDPASSDSDHRTDYFAQKPSRGGQNAVTVLINEIFPGTVDAVELYNPSVETVRMDGWQLWVFNQDGTVDAVFNFPSDFELQPNRYVVLRETAGVNTETDLFMNDSISWPSTNPAGAVLLTNGDSELDFLVFGNEAVNELSLADIADNLQDTGWTGPSPLPPLPNEALGRDSVSTDTDAGADWYPQIPSLGSVNPMARPLPNDNFGDAIEILSVPFRDIADTSGAEMSNVGEPEPSCGFNVGFQVWYKYTPPTSTLLRFQTDGSKIDTVLSIWTDATTEVACDDDNSPDDTRSRIDLALTGGTTYFIGVGGKNNTPGQVVLSLLPPANDDFDEAIVVGGLPFSNSQNTIAASSPLDDPTTSCGSFDGRSVWYSFTAATDDAVRFHTEGSNYNTILSVWTGARGTLAQIACNDNIGETALSSISLQPVIGQTYYIMAGGPTDGGGQLIFNATLLIPPPNDDFVNSINVADLEADPYNENTLGATEEDLDPEPSCGINTSKTVWFTYVAESSQTIAFQTFGSNFDTVMSIWSQDLSAELGCNDDAGAGRQSYLEFSGAPGETYYVVVSGHQGEGGDLIFETFLLGNPPDNDEPEGAFVVSPLPYSFDQPENEIANATVSVNEPTPTCGVDVAKTVWYEFTPDTDGTFSIETLGSDYDTVLAVYQDGMLAEVVCDDDAIVDGTSRVLLNASSGTTYLIMVGGWNGDSGNLHLEVEAVDTAPAFDDQDTPKIIPNVPYDDSDSTVFATDAFDDPVPTCGVSVGKTVWYQYTPPTNALLLFDTNGSSFDTNLSIYLVTPDGLVEVACDDDSGDGLTSFAEFAPEAGETYLIMIGGTSGSSGQLNLHVESVEPPANDEFENATDLSDVFVLDLLDVRGATNAGDDPVHSCNANTGRTVWYTVTPTQNGTMSFNTLGSNYNTVMSVYELENDGSLTEIACDDNSGDNLTSRIDNLPSTPNQTYYVMVSGAFGQTGNLNFNVALLVPPANDEIEGAFDITGTVFDFNQDTTGASNAPDDPLSCGLLAGKTVWYDYEATGDDLLRIDVSGSDFNTIVAAYTGDRGSLTQIGCEFFGTLDIVTQPGETYHILIGGFGGESGNLDLHAEVVGIPDNDPVDGAFEIPSLPYTNSQTTDGATRINEPPVTCDFTVGKTVWYHYSADGSEGLLHFDSVGSDFSTVIAVYQDTESGLVQVGCNTFGAVEVPAEAGDYFIMIGGWRGKSGQLVFNASSIPQPDNDEFENATEVGQLPFADDVNTDGASSDSGDPLTCEPTSGKTIWYVFHSLGDGILHINTDGSLFNTVIAVYKDPGPIQGQVNFGPLLELDLLACEKGNQLDVPVEGGETYYIMISGEEGDSGQLHIEITGEITPTPPHITVEKIANPSEASEPGGEVLFTVNIHNASIFGAVTINSITDDVYGNMCDVLLPAILNAGDTLTCIFTQFVAGQPGDDHSDTVHVTGFHQTTGAPVAGSDDATVTIVNLPSSISVTKMANPVSLAEPGGLVEFTVDVENTSAADNVTLTSLMDSLFGDMSVQCGLPVDLTPGQTFSCVFTGNITGESGDTQVNTVEVSGTDDDGQPVSNVGSAVVNITCALPDPERDLRGSLPSRTRGVITNTSLDCFYVVGMASYERPDDNIDNQRLFDYSSAVIGPNETLNLFIDVPTCALQVDLFYGEVLFSLNGVRYGDRLLANRVSTNLPFCDFSLDQFNLTASLEEGTTNVHLNWTDNLLVEATYHLERSDDGAIFNEIAVVPANTTSYLDSGLCYTHYWYRIRAAYDVGGPFTAYSSVAEVTTSCPALAAPSALSAEAVSDTQIDLAWTDSSSDETSFHIERSPDGIAWAEIASVPADATNYPDGGLTCATPYQYRVRAFRSIDAQFSAYTNVAGDTTAACPPPPLSAPSDLTATGVSETQIDLAWADNSSDETAFNIERSPDGITWLPLASVSADTTSYQDSGLTCNTTYHYRVFAFRIVDSQTSDASNVAAATTFACPIVLSVPEPISNTVGLYKDGLWQFREATNEAASVTSFTFGEAGWLPVIGDWDGDGTDGLGLYKDGQWILRSSVGGVLSDTAFAFGAADAGWQPVVGDWNGDGVDTVGLYKAGQWLLRNSNTAGDADITFGFGQHLSGALPIAGDWNGDGVDTVGLYLNGQWYLLDVITTTDSVTPIAFGPVEAGWLPIVGDWNGDGADTIGLVKDGLWRLRNTNGDGATDLGFSFGLGATGWLPVRSFSGDLSAFLANLPITTPPTVVDPPTATESPTVTETSTPEVSETPVSESVETEATPTETATEETVIESSVTESPTTEALPTEPPTPEVPAPEGTSEAG